MPEEHLVEEQRHDLFLREFLFDAHSERCFLEFALDSAIERQEIATRQLLCQRTAARLDLALRDQLVNRTQQAAIVDARVFPETFVLGGDKSVDNVLGHLVVRDQDAPPLAEFGNQVTITTEYAQGNLQRDVANRLSRRQRGCDVVVRAYDTRHTSNRAGRAEPE